jgi:cysteinyl-tRNA synthetase
MFETVRGANQALGSGDSEEAGRLTAAVREMAAAVGLRLAGVEEAPADVVQLVEERERARAGRDFAAADRLRDEVFRLGWVVEDTPQGPRVHKRR